MKARGSTAFKEGEQMAPKLKKIDSHLHVWASLEEVTCIMSYCLHFYFGLSRMEGQCYVGLPHHSCQTRGRSSNYCRLVCDELNFCTMD